MDLLKYVLLRLSTVFKTLPLTACSMALTRYSASAVNQRCGRMDKTFGLNDVKSGVRIPGRAKFSIRTTAADARVKYPLYLALAATISLQLFLMNVACASLISGSGFEKIHTDFCKGLVKTRYDAESVVSIQIY